MTAYELSDQLIECITDGSTDLVCVEQAAHMLRQQADRIVELEQENKQIKERTWDSDFARQFLAEIRETKERHGIK